MLLNLQERLWNQAYDELKADEPQAIDAYETILSNRLDPNNSPKNEIGKTPDARREQMQQLVQNGLERSCKESSIKQRIGQGLEVVQSVKEIVDKAIQVAPQAAVAWVGVCVGLEILSKPITEARSNREGIAYVVSRMNWYWNLSCLLLDENKAIDSSVGLRDELENHIVQLYKKLLLYQINSVCLYHRNQLVIVGRDLLSLDDWAGQLSDIKTAQDAVNKDAEQYSSEQIKEYMSKELLTAVSVEGKLDSIDSAIQYQAQQQEQRHQDDKDNQCLKDLYETNPSKDKERIQDTKGGLLRDSYLWIFDHADFRQFRNDPQNRLLWIKGDPGKGKTMLMCGIIDELQKKPSLVLSYFFCQATEAQLNNATSVLRGLMYLLLEQRPSLISHLRIKYNTTGKKLFQGANVWVTLVEIFTDMVNNTELKDAIFMVDALDECATDRHKLLDFIVKLSATCPVKWVVSSRDWTEIGQKLHKAKQKVNLYLELNQELISEAVDTYIAYKVNQLANDKEYDEETRTIVKNHLTLCITDQHHDIFLRSLEALSQTLKRDIYSLNALGLLADQISPPDLDLLATIRYSSVYWVDHLGDSKSTETGHDCDSSIIYDFLQHKYLYWLESLSLLRCVPEGVVALQKLEDVAESTKLQQLADIVQDARRFILSHKQPIETAPLQVYASALLFSPTGSLIKKLFTEQETWIAMKSPIGTDWTQCLQTLEGHNASVRSVAFLCDSKLIASASEDGIIQTWAADTGKCMQTPKGYNDKKGLAAFSHDFKLLASAKHTVHVWIWCINTGKCIQTLEGHDDSVTSVAFSHNSKLLASCSRDKTIQVWRVNTGECMQVLEGHVDFISSVVFSHNSKLLASSSHDETIRIWRADTGECMQMLKGHDGDVESVVFSHDSKLIASGSDDTIIRIWRVGIGEYMQIHDDEDYSYGAKAVAISHNSRLVAALHFDPMIRIYLADTGECIQTISTTFDTDTLSFGLDDARLITWQHSPTMVNNIHSVRTSADPPPRSPARLLTHHGAYGISEDKCWVTLNGENTLWLPVEFRPYCWAGSECIISIGCQSAGILILGRSCGGMSEA